MRNLQTYEDFLLESALNEIGDMKPLDWDDIKVNGKTTTYEFYLGPEFYEVDIVRVNNTKMSVSNSIKRKIYGEFDPGSE